MTTNYKQMPKPLPFEMDEAKELIADADIHSLRRIALGYATLAHGGAVNYLEMKNENERLREEANKYRDRAIEMAKLIIRIDELEKETTNARKMAAAEKAKASAITAKIAAIKAVTAV